MNLEIERKKLELKRVGVAGDEMRFKILERRQDIERLEDNIEIQEKREKELILQIKEMEKVEGE